MMSTEQDLFYALVTSKPASNQCWHVKKSIAVRVGVPNPTKRETSFLNLDSHTPIDEQFKKAYAQIWGHFQLKQKLLAPGQYYPRMARPLDQHHPGSNKGYYPLAAHHSRAIAGVIGQLISLEGRIREICQVIEPEPGNLSVYGHTIRECLVISAMEVESQWKAILKENEFVQCRLTTNDYIKILPAMRLDEYEIIFRRFPTIKPIRPFQGWKSDAPTESLKFFDSYNAVKHNREAEFNRGTLEMALQSVAACVVLAVAQFSETLVLLENTSLREFFYLSEYPQWGASETYTSSTNEWPRKLVPYPF